MTNVFKITEVPFSYHGSWMSISIPRDENDLFLRNHYVGGGNMFPLRMLIDGETVKPDISEEPWVLTMSYGDARIEVCFATTKTIRMRGRGCGLQMGKRDFIYSCGPSLFAFNKPFTRRYQVEILKGDFELHQLVPTQPVFPKTAEIRPDTDGTWEIAVDEFTSTWLPRERADFDACVAATKEVFNDFLSAMPPVRDQDREPHRLATYVDWATTVEPCYLVKRPSILMSKNWMDNVWSWDHAFNAMALAAGHPGLALDQMLCMVDHQDEFGCFPDSFKDLDITYNFSKPPVHGWAFSELLKRLPEPPDHDMMETMYASLSAQANWWMQQRVLGAYDSSSATPDSPGLDDCRRMPYYLHGNDSGWDNSTMFRQGVPLVAPDLSALLIVQMDVLTDLARSLEKPDEAEAWHRRADNLYELLMQVLWSGDHFVARLGNTGAAVESKSLIPWLPVILGTRLPLDVRNCLKKGIAAHLTEWGLATERVDSEHYREDGYWRGPIWAPSTYIAVSGLERCGFTDLANDIAKKFCRMCARSGFPENFNAVTGDALRCPSYTWTSSVFILLAERMNQ